MKILHVVPWLQNGLSYEENMLPPLQAARGHEVIVAASDAAPDKKKSQYPIGRSQESRVEVERLKGIHIRPFDKPFLHGLRSLILEEEPDVIHAHAPWAPSTLQAVAAPQRGALVVDDHTDNGNQPTGPSGPIKRAVGRFTVARVRAAGGAFIVVNPHARSHLTKVLRAPAACVHEMPLPVSSHLFSQDWQARRRCRAEMSLEESTVFLSGGRLTPNKGFEDLIEALGRLDSRSATHLILVGSGTPDYEKLLRAKCERENINSRVTFVPWCSQSQLGILFNAADVSVIPGKLGGIKDALATATPLIVPRHPATAYLAGESGLTFEPGNVEDLAAQMEVLATDPALRRRLSEGAKHRAAGELSWSSFADRTLEIYAAASLNSTCSQRTRAKNQVP